MSQMGSTMLGEFISLDALEPVDEKTFKKDDFFPAAWEGGVKDGKAYGVPWYVDTRALYYRTDLAEKAGVKEPPATWKDQNELAKAYKDKAKTKWGIYNQPANVGAWQTWLPFLFSAGGELVDSSGKPALDSPEAVEALTEYCPLLREGPVEEVLAARLRRGQGLRFRRRPDVHIRPLDRPEHQRPAAPAQGQVRHRPAPRRASRAPHGSAVRAWSPSRTVNTRQPPRSSRSTWPARNSRPTGTRSPSPCPPTSPPSTSRHSRTHPSSSRPSRSSSRPPRRCRRSPSGKSSPPSWTRASPASRRRASPRRRPPPGCRRRPRAWWTDRMTTTTPSRRGTPGRTRHSAARGRAGEGHGIVPP